MPSALARLIGRLERRHPDVPMRPANPVKREVEHIRHGTLCLMGAYDVRRHKLFGFVSKDHDSRTFVDGTGGQQFGGVPAPHRDENRGRSCAIGTLWTKTNRPAVWLPAGGVGGDRPRRPAQAEPKSRMQPTASRAQTPRKSASEAGGRLPRVHRGRSTRSPRPRQAAIPPADPCRGSRPAASDCN